MCELSTESCHGISSAASSRQVDGYELSTAPCHGASSATSTRCIGELVGEMLSIERLVAFCGYELSTEP